MESLDSLGQIVILNGAPRSGKSSIAAIIQDRFDGPWMNLGVDVIAREVTAVRYQPGIGLRPGGERPDLEPFVVRSYAALYDSIAAHSRQGLNVVADLGHHNAYATAKGILLDCTKRLEGLPVLYVGVLCPTETIMERRNSGEGSLYVKGTPEDPVPEPVMRWQQEVHNPRVYDLEVDTSKLSPEECAELIRQRLEAGPGTAFRDLARWADRAAE
jgi:chloramphenicol 3-O phosphotransferase